MLRIVGKTYDIPSELLEKVANATFSYLGQNDAEIELKFVSEREIFHLNSIYRGNKATTDILSFSLDEKPLLGQIFICYTLTKRQAIALQKDFWDEVALLLVHGILHVAGYDHITPKEESDMQKIEKTILAKEGIQR
jgi:probable rRNA maturation factor